jgi:hypothetical protein
VVAERARGQDGGGQLAGGREPPGEGVAVGDLVDGVVDRLADPDIGDRPGSPVGSERQEQLSPGGVDRQPPGSLGVGPERGEPGLGHVAGQRQVGLPALDRPLDRRDTDAELHLDPIRPRLAQGVGGRVPVGIAVQDDQPSGRGWSGLGAGADHMPGVVGPDLVAGRVLAWHRGEQRQARIDSRSSAGRVPLRRRPPAIHRLSRSRYAATASAWPMRSSRAAVTRATIAGVVSR